MSNAVLMILTSHRHLGNSGNPTGSWLEELAAPYYVFLDAGLRVDFASIGGGAAPLDPVSLEPAWRTDAGARFMADAAALDLLRDTSAIATVAGADYGAIFFVGGSGSAWDFPTNPDAKRLVEELHGRGALIAGVCHGVLGLITAQATDGLTILKARRVTGISSREDELAGVAQIVPLLAEVHLKKAGAIYLAAAPFTANVVIDGNVMTGQNPASALPLAQALVRRLGGEMHVAA